MDFIKFIPLAILCVAAFIFVVRWLTGWNAFERSYRCGREFPAGWVSTGSYRRVPATLQGTRIGLDVEVFPEALWLRASSPLFFAFRPLCIPWHAIESAASQADGAGEKTCLKIVDAGSPIYVSGVAGKRVREAFLQARDSM